VHARATHPQAPKPSLTMFSVLLTSYLAVHIAGALPTQVLSTDIQPSTCTDITHCRSLSNIIWSCLATVLACAWAALHPNVPGVDEGFFTVTLRLAKMTVMVVTAPELLIFWAILQWITARVLATKYAGMSNAMWVAFYNPIPRIWMDADSWLLCAHGRLHGLWRGRKAAPITLQRS